MPNKRCEACALGDIDLTTTAFSAIADINSGQSFQASLAMSTTHTCLYKVESMASNGRSTQWAVAPRRQGRLQALRLLHQRQQLPLPPQPKVCVFVPILVPQLTRSCAVTTSTSTSTTAVHTTTSVTSGGACAGVAAWSSSAVYTGGMTATYGKPEACLVLWPDMH